MQVALIPPANLITALPPQVLEKNEYHLVLPSSLKYPLYLQFYTGLRKVATRSKVVILDNGAAEDHTLNAYDLHHLAEQIGAHEIVVPDVLGDCEQTKEKVLEFAGHRKTGRNVRYMGVVQGHHMNDIADMLRFYNDQQWITAIGIPRNLVQRIGMNGRMQVCDFIHLKYGRSRWAVHLLGAAHTYPQEVAAIAGKHSWVRGIDTSMPFNYARYGLFLGAHHYITRPTDYNDYSWQIGGPADELQLILNNIARYREWAHATP